MGAFIDISNKQFGNWLVLEYDKASKKWVCECQCDKHTIKLIASADLRKGKTTNCGCMRKKELSGKTFGHLYVESYAENYHWNCKCVECGKEFIVHTYHLEHNNLPNCTHSDLHANVIDISGKTFGQWKVLSYAGGGYWNCECQCELHTNRKVLGKDIRSGASKSCGLDNKSSLALLSSSHEFIDIGGQRFGDWAVIEYVGNGYWKCECQCENKTIKNVKGVLLRAGITKSCGHNSGVVKDIKGKVFGTLTAKEYIGDKMWRCECSCGELVNVSGHDLRSGHTKHCKNSIHRIQNIKDYRFGLLVAKEYIGNCKWKCRCDCGNTIEVYGTNLRSGHTKSCGCVTYDLRINTLINNGQLDYRTFEQIDALKSEEKLRSFIGTDKLTPYELSNKLGISYSYITNNIRKKYNIEDLININNNGTSELETDIIKYIKSIYSGDIQSHDRNILRGQELDIYIPDKKLAIEFNGTYWHSDVQKPKLYHQEKTIKCAKHGIQLLHIFEYEWIDSIKREKIKKHIANIIGYNTTILYARNMVVKEISSNESEDFEIRNHLQSSAKAKIRIGIFDNKELVGVMTFGKPRFNSNFEYELLRLCYKGNVKIIGGIEKMFKYFVSIYNPQSLITYSDISKFTGNAYLEIGFKVINITQPNYVWVSPNRDLVLSGYQTQKHKLVEQGLETSDQTEDEIMKQLGYIKVYDSGNIILEWMP